jgi:hypothetical protein
MDWPHSLLLASRDKAVAAVAASPTEFIDMMNVDDKCFPFFQPQNFLIYYMIK